jgi:hypothetical protein
MAGCILTQFNYKTHLRDTRLLTLKSFIVNHKTHRVWGKYNISTNDPKNYSSVNQMNELKVIAVHKKQKQFTQNGDYCFRKFIVSIKF